jgi:peptidoglycan/xylan/chitin deacetylase (PgdA/CDA1 family)
MTMESMYEYGSRAGVWRILREFDARKLPLTVFGVAMALERYPELVGEFMRRDHEIACHGLRWIHYQHMPEAAERRHLDIATRVLKELSGGAWPLGWYTGRDSPNTRRLVVEHGGYEYDSDYYGDDLPFWAEVEKATARRRRTCRPVFARHQRHALRPGAGLQHRRALSSPTCATPSTRCTRKATRRASTGRR